MKMRAMLLPLVLILSGCLGNGYKDFYSRVPGVSPEMIAQTRAAPAAVSPRVERARDASTLAEAYGRQGYFPIGYSSFNGGSGQSDAGAISQAKEVGADLVVIVDPTYTESKTANIPVTTPTSTTSQSTGNATVYGPAGTSSVYGSATTTTYGSKTTYIPMTIDRYDYGAMYL
jgi:hypothetical protein